MGNCKDQLTPSNNSKFGLFPKRKKNDTKEESPKKLADIILKAEELINELIDEKTKDFQNEKGGEDKNRIKLACLKAMRYHIESVIDVAQEYHNA